MGLPCICLCLTGLCLFALISVLLWLVGGYVSGLLSRLLGCCTGLAVWTMFVVSLIWVRGFNCFDVCVGFVCFGWIAADGLLPLFGLFVYWFWVCAVCFLFLFIGVCLFCFILLNWLNLWYFGTLFVGLFC